MQGDDLRVGDLVTYKYPDGKARLNDHFDHGLILRSDNILSDDGTIQIKGWRIFWPTIAIILFYSDEEISLLQRRP